MAGSMGSPKTQALSSTYDRYTLDIFRYFYMSYQGSNPHWYVYDAEMKDVSFASCYYEESDIDTTVQCTFWELNIRLMGYYGSLSLTKAFLFSF